MLPVLINPDAIEEGAEICFHKKARKVETKKKSVSTKGILDRWLADADMQGTQL